VKEEKKIASIGRKKYENNTDLKSLETPTGKKKRRGEGRKGRSRSIIAKWKKSMDRSPYR